MDRKLKYEWETGELYYWDPVDNCLVKELMKYRVADLGVKIVYKFVYDNYNLRAEIEPSRMGVVNRNGASYFIGTGNDEKARKAFVAAFQKKKSEVMERLNLLDIWLDGVEKGEIHNVY